MYMVTNVYFSMHFKTTPKLEDSNSFTRTMQRLKYKVAKPLNMLNMKCGNFEEKHYL